MYYEIDEIAPDTYRHTHHVVPIAYVSNGTLRRITNDIVNTGDPNFTIGVDEFVQFRLRDSLVGNAPVLFFGKGNNSLRLTPLDTNNVDAVVGDHIISYPGAWDNADLRFLVAGHCVQKEIVLGANHPTSFAFRIDDHIGLDLDTLQSDSFRILDPILTNGSESIPLQWAKTTQGGKLILTVDLPVGDFNGWILDPTFTSQPDGTAGLDTFVREDQADTAQATSTTLVVQGTATVRRNSLIKWDLSSIPAGATVTSGTLTVWNALQVTTAYSMVWSRILAANSAWTEAGATWNYAVDGATRWAGDAAANGGSDAGCSVSGTDYSGTNLGAFTHGDNDVVGTQYDATMSVAETQSLLSANHGVVLRTTTGGGSARLYASSDNATAAQRPQLVIVYTVATSDGGRRGGNYRGKWNYYRVAYRRSFKGIK